LNLAGAHLHYPGSQLVDEVPVMGNEDDAAPVMAQGFEQHFLGLEIKVIGRFVQQQQIGRPQQQNGQGQAVFFAPGQDRHRFLHIVPGKQEGAKDVPHPRHHVEGRRIRDLLQHGGFRIQGPGLILGKIGQLQIMALPPRTPARRLGCRQQAHQGRFAGAVGTDQGQPLAPLHGQVHVLQHAQGPVAMLDPLQGQNLPATGGRIGEAESDGLALRRHLDAFDFFQLLDAALNLRRAIGLIAEAADESLDTGDFLVLTLAGRPQGSHARFPGNQVLAVVARILGKAAVPQFDNAPNHAIEEEPIMGHQDHGEGIVDQVFFQPVAGRQVEMVGRLIEQQQIGPAQQQFGQGDAHLPTTGKMLAGTLPVGLGKPQSGQDLADFGGHGVAAALAERLLQRCVARHRLRAAGGGNLLLQILQLGFHGHQFGQG